MDVISIIGVSRGNEYSPNHVDNDAAIFYKVTEELRRLGCEVKVYAEKDFVEQGVKGDIIFDMARDVSHAHQQCVRFQFLQILTHTCYFSLSFCCLFLIKAILVGVKWCFIVVLIYISLMIDGVKHLFICLLVIVYFWRNTFIVLRV